MYIMPLRITDIGVTPPGTIAIYLPVSGLTMVSIRSTARLQNYWGGIPQDPKHATINCGATTPICLLTCHRLWPLGHRVWTITNFWKFYLHRNSRVFLNNKNNKICSFGDSNPCSRGHDRNHSHALTAVLTVELWTRTSYVVVNIDLLWVMHYFIPTLVYATTPPREQLC